MRFLQILLGFSLALAGAVAQGQIYKWTDAQGHLHYGDRPTSGGQAEVVTPQINTYSGVEVTTEESIPSSDEPAQHPGVTLYGTTWCGVCKRARAYLAAQHIPYTEYDVEQSEKGKRDFAAMHGHGVPIILVGHQRMNGFDEASFNAMYGKAG